MKNKSQKFKCIPVLHLLQSDVDSLFLNKMKQIIPNAKGQIPDATLEYPPVYLKEHPYTYHSQMIMFNGDYIKCLRDGTNCIVVAGAIYCPTDDYYIIDSLKYVKSNELAEKIRDHELAGWSLKHLKTNPPMTKEEKKEIETDIKNRVKGKPTEISTLEADLTKAIQPKVGFVMDKEPS